MIPYNIRFPSAALAAGTLFAGLVSAAAKFLFVIELDFEGYGAGTSSNNEAALYRVSTAGTSSTAATAVPVNSNHPAAGFTSFSAYSAQPTKGAIVHNMPINGNGQRYNWKALPNLIDAIVVPAGGGAGGTLIADAITGTAAIGGRIKVLEV